MNSIALTRKDNPFLTNGLFVGSAAAKHIMHALRGLMSEHKSKNCLKLNILLVGDNKSSGYFVQKKQKQAADLGIQTEVTYLQNDVSLDTVLQLIRSWNKDRLVHGIVVQLPLPDHLDLTLIRSTIAAVKDVDGMNHYNFATTSCNRSIPIMTQKNDFRGTQQKPDQLWCCDEQGKRCLILTSAVVNAAIVIMRNLLSGKELLGKNALIINDSFLIGRPLGQVFLNSGCTVTLAHVNTVNLKQKIAAADVIVTATGKIALFDIAETHPQAIVLDLGSNYDSGRIQGDVRYDPAIQLQNRILTPVPGGIGPLTVAMLMYNVIMAYRHQASRSGSKLSWLYDIDGDFNLVDGA